MANAFLITGKTYPHRRALRALGGIFDRDEMGYILPASCTNAADYASTHDLDIAEYDATEDQLTPATGERLREIRQDRIERRRARLHAWADAADRRADKHHNRLQPHERDFLRLGEPVKVGHHSERRHRKLIDKAWNSALEAGREHATAEKLRQRADFMLDAQIKGDAERRRQRIRDHVDRTVSVGDLVTCSHYGPSIVLKINRKSVRVRVEKTGDEMTYEKHWISLIEKRDPAPKPKPKFKRGDQVLVQPWSHKPKYRGTVLRRTPNGYSVEFAWRFGVNGSEHTSKQTFQEQDIELAPQEGDQ